MSPPPLPLPPTPDVPEPTVRDIHALYREAAGAEPGALLDRRILDAARAELEAGNAAKRRGLGWKAWWKAWLPATTAIAAVVVGLSVTWRVMDEQERGVREEMKASGAADETSRKEAPAANTTQAMPATSAPAPAAEKSRSLESKALQNAAPGVAEPAAQPAPSAEPRVFPGAEAPAAMAPAAAEVDLKKNRRAESDGLRERRDANIATDSAPVPARQADKLEAQGSAVGAVGTGNEAAAESVPRPAAKSLAAPAADAVPPAAWLQQIRELRAAGRDAEAAQSLARFRARYPEFTLPADLADPK